MLYEGLALIRSSKESVTLVSVVNFTSVKHLHWLLHWFHSFIDFIILISSHLHPFFISMSHHHWLQSSLLMELESWWLPLVKAFLLVTRHIWHMTNMTFIGLKENLKRSENWLTISLRTILTTSSTDWKQSNLIIHSGGQSTQIKYLSKSTDTYNKILLQ